MTGMWQENLRNIALDRSTASKLESVHFSNSWLGLQLDTSH